MEQELVVELNAELARSILGQAHLSKSKVGLYSIELYCFKHLPQAGCRGQSSACAGSTQGSVGQPYSWNRLWAASGGRTQPVWHKLHSKIVQIWI